MLLNSTASHYAVIRNAVSSDVPKTQSWLTCCSHFELMQESNQEFLTWEAADGRVALQKVGERSKHDVFFAWFPFQMQAMHNDSYDSNGLF